MKRWQQVTQQELKKYVPDPDGEIERLQEQLKIATKALKDIKVYSQRDWDEYNCMECADKALKEMEGVK